MKKRRLTPLGMMIKKRLIDLDKTQSQLAKEVGTSKVYLNHILHGEKSGKKYLRKILSVLEIDPLLIQKEQEQDHEQDHEQEHERACS